VIPFVNPVTVTGLDDVAGLNGVNVDPFVE
jgi:hypothetical protein